MISLNALLRNGRAKYSQIFKLARHFSFIDPTLHRVTDAIKVSPNVKVFVDSKHNVKVQPYDVLDCPDGNLFRATIMSKEPLKDTDFLKIKYLDDLNMIEIEDHSADHNVKPSLIHVFMEVPPNADLKIKSNETVQVSNMLNEFIAIDSIKGIRTKNLYSVRIDLISKDGYVECEGTTLAKSVEITTGDDGKIVLHKIQGDNLVVNTDCGEIHTKSCYSADSHFKTNNGTMHLKNVHKNCKVDINSDGDLNMQGFNGTLTANILGSGKMVLQLSNIIATSRISSASSKQAIVNISDSILTNSYVMVSSNTAIEFSPNLRYLEPSSAKYHALHKVGHGIPGNDNRLEIETDGKVLLGKMSWEDSFDWNILNNKDINV